MIKVDLNFSWLNEENNYGIMTNEIVIKSVGLLEAVEQIIHGKDKVNRFLLPD